MVTTLTFKGFLKDVKTKYAHHSGIVGIMLIKATKGNSDNNELVVNFYEEWDSLTSYAEQPMYVFWAGYGCWLSPSDEDQRRIILDAYDNRENRRIYFDNQKYGKFKRELSAFWNDQEIEWGSTANLLLLNCVCGELDFPSGKMITLDDYERFGYRTRAGFCEAILEKCHVCDSVATLLLQISKPPMEKPAVLPHRGSEVQAQTVINQHFYAPIFNGDMTSSQIVTGSNSTATYNANSMSEAVKEIIETLKKETIPYESMEKALKMLDEISSNITKGNKPGVIKSSLIVLKDFLVATGANVAGALITGYINGFF